MFNPQSDSSRTEARPSMAEAEAAARTLLRWAGSDAADWGPIDLTALVGRTEAAAYPVFSRSYPDGFSPDAGYHTEPYRPPWRGRDELVRRWLGRKDEPGETEFRVHRVVDAASRPHRLTDRMKPTKVEAPGRRGP